MAVKFPNVRRYMVMGGTFKAFYRKLLFAALLSVSVGPVISAPRLEVPALWHSYIPFSGFGPEPVIKGKYFVCPDGSAAHKFGPAKLKDRWWSKYWGQYGEKMYRLNKDTGRDGVYSLSAKIYIMKSVGSYSYDEISAIMNNLLESDVEALSSYSAVNFSFIDRRGSTSTRMTLENGEGKVINLMHDAGYGSITDSKGKEFTINSAAGSESKLFCPPGRKQMHRRIVERIKLKATDAFGEQKDLPLMFMVTNLYVNRRSPSLENVPSF